MNRRLPRIALLVVLLLSTLVVYQIGGASGTPVNQAAALEDCGPWAPFDPSQEPAVDPEAATQVAYPNLSRISIQSGQVYIQSGGDNGNELDATVLSTSIKQGNQVSFVSTGSVAIWVESGSVEVHVCTDSNVSYQQAGEGQDVVVLTTGDDPPKVTNGGSIFVGAGAAYYLAGVDTESKVLVSADRPFSIPAVCGSAGC